MCRVTRGVIDGKEDNCVVVVVVFVVVFFCNLVCDTGSDLAHVCLVPGQDILVQLHRDQDLQTVVCHLATVSL